MAPAKYHLVKYLRRWHRRLGIAVALFAVLLAVTGLLLNHTEELELDSTYVHSNVLLNWYGIRAPDAPLSYAAGGHWMSQLGERLYFDDRELPVDEPGRLLGAVTLADRIIIALEGRLLLLTLSGDLLETLDGAQGVPAGMRQIGVKDDKLVIRASHGDYLADKDLLHWEESAAVGDRHVPGVVGWAKANPVPENLHARLAEVYRGKGLTLERVVLDLHSGRIAGQTGVVIMDAAAILLILLAVSGIWMWIRHLGPARH